MTSLTFMILSILFGLLSLVTYPKNSLPQIESIKSSSGSNLVFKEMFTNEKGNLVAVYMYKKEENK